MWFVKMVSQVYLQSHSYCPFGVLGCVELCYVSVYIFYTKKGLYIKQENGLFEDNYCID